MLPVPNSDGARPRWWHCLFSAESHRGMLARPGALVVVTLILAGSALEFVARRCVQLLAPLVEAARRRNPRCLSQAWPASG